MNTFLEQLFNLFIAPPGSLIYYLVLAFAITGAFQAVLVGRQASQKYPPGRMIVGLSLLLAGQVALFIASGLAWQGFLDPHIVLPPLDRAAAALSMVWVAWLWLVPTANRLADALAGLLSLVVAVGFGFTLNSWAAFPPGMSFNSTIFDQVWTLATAAILVVGMVFLFVRRPEGWGIGLSMLTFNLAGNLVHFLWPELGGDFSGVVRLAQLCSFPLLPVLAQRGRAAAAVPTPAPSAAIKLSRPADGVQIERRHYSADPRTVYNWLQLAVSSDSGHTFAEFTRAFTQTMLADVGLLLKTPEPGGKVSVLAGYDLIHEEYLHLSSLDRESIPAVANALQKGRALRLGGDDGSTPDLVTFAGALNLERTGYLMLVPLANPPAVWGGLLLLSPYSNRAWSADDQTYLLSSIDTMVTVLSQGETGLGAGLSAPVDNYARIKDELQLAHQQIEEMKGDNRILLEEIAALRGGTPVNPDLESLLAVQRETQEIITSLQEENERLQASLAARGSQHLDGAGAPSKTAGEDSTGGLGQVEDELRLALEQSAHLQNALAESNMQLLALQKMERQSVKRWPVEEDGAVLAALIQELRQPMASITGYTDLLLAETAGIIGALQRNFLERIKGSIERMQGIMNDLVQLTDLQSGPPELAPESINASVLIDEAISAISSQLRSKNITLRVDMPDELPEIQADRDALQQIVVHLLQNAGSVTPVEGTISLKLRVQPDDRGLPAMLFQVTDSGGGISDEDLPRVFSRRYRADNPLIQGVGDTGVGLSIARTLVEAHQGRIWVESLSGQSSTFSVLLPLNPRSEPAPGAS